MAETGNRRPAQKAFPQKARPALVIQNYITNRFGMTTIVAAIASRVSTSSCPNEAILQPGRTGLEVVSAARLDQIRTVDRQRLIKRLGKVDAVTMNRVDEAIGIRLGLVGL